MLEFMINILAIIFWGMVIYFIVKISPVKKMKLENFWSYGTTKPIQRVGLIILNIGLISFLAWIYEDVNDWSYLVQSYSFPQKNDSTFYHLHVYFIPIGLVMTWLYPLLRKCLSKLSAWIFKNK